jgi:arylsulfatase
MIVRYNPKLLSYGLSLGTVMAASAAILCMVCPARAADNKKPNILVIMGDDVGWFNIGAYHRG